MSDTWDYIRSCHGKFIGRPISRTPIIAAAYLAHRQKLAAAGDTIENYIRRRYPNLPVCELNDFPYDFGSENVEHKVMWLPPETTEDDLVHLLQRLAAQLDGLHQVVTANDPQYRSINLPHLHIFTRRRPVMTSD